MYFQTSGLPPDTHEVFFSDRFYYTSTVARRRNGKPVAVGCGSTIDAAIEDMRRLVRDKAGVEGCRPQLQSTRKVRAQDSPTVLNDAERSRLGCKLRALRVTARLSQLQVARGALGFTKSHAAVSRLERGQIPKVDSKVVAKLMRFLRAAMKKSQ